MTFDELSLAVHEELNARIVAVTLDDTAYRVRFNCDDWQGRDMRRRFELICDDVQESTATPSDLYSLRAASDHPLLWNYNDDHLTMYFSSAPPDPMALVGQLYEAHSRLLNGWRQLSDYLYADSALMQQGYGQFAKGPRRVIEEYARVVGDQCRFSMIQGHTPRGGCRIVLFGDLFVVCRGVSVVEHNSDS